MKLAALLVAISTLAPAQTGLAEDPEGAFKMAVYFVRNGLKAPSTAQFCSFEDAKIKMKLSKKGDRMNYEVRGWLDAQNSYGAMLRSYFLCKLYQKAGDSEHWFAELTAIDERRL